MPKLRPAWRTAMSDIGKAMIERELICLEAQARPGLDRAISFSRVTAMIALAHAESCISDDDYDAFSRRANQAIAKRKEAASA